MDPLLVPYPWDALTTKERKVLNRTVTKKLPNNPFSQDLFLLLSHFCFISAGLNYK